MLDLIKNYFSKPEEKQTVEIVEGISGRWTYHLKKPDKTKSLCKRRIMPSKVTDWGVRRPSHLPISFCSSCEQKAKNQNLSIQ